MNLIDTTEKLAQFCDILNKQSFITVDSEFIRERTYYPRLCLLQLGYDGGAAIVDPLAKDMDLSPFFAVLDNPNVVKVFHAGRQDIEIFYNLTGKIPANVFDTQIAAMVCGFADNVEWKRLEVRFAEHHRRLFTPSQAEAILAALREDPRPQYHRDPERVYGMPFAGYDIRFKVNGNIAVITDIIKEKNM